MELREVLDVEGFDHYRQQGERKPSNQSNGSGGSEQASQESSPQSSPRKQQRGEYQQGIAATCVVELQSMMKVVQP